jgi:hypothetical protein
VEAVPYSDEKQRKVLYATNNHGSGHFWPPPFMVYMSTAIAIVWNEYGFGITADGRHCEEGTNSVISNHVQKIFPIDLIGKQLAYALAGIIQINGATANGEKIVLFDFAEAISDALNRIEAAGEPSLWHFAHALGGKLLEQIKVSLMLLKDPRESTTQILIAGYFNGPECVAIQFTVHASPESPRYEVSRIKLERDVPIPCGSRAILLRLQGHDDDEMLAKYRPAASNGHKDILRAIEIAKNTVLAHFDPAIRALDPETCARIGGHVHVAKIDKDGFSWVIPPKGIQPFA